VDAGIGGHEHRPVVLLALPLGVANHPLAVEGGVEVGAEEAGSVPHGLLRRAGERLDLSSWRLGNREHVDEGGHRVSAVT
jgi:hypothetical protein